MGLSKRQVRVLFAVGVVLGVVAVPAIAAVFDNAAEVNGVTLHAADGPAARFTESAEANLTDFTSDPNTIDYHSTAGNISISSNGRTNVTVTRINGSWTNASSIDTGSRTLTLDPDDKSAVAVSGAVQKIHYRDDADIALGDGEVDFVYSATGSGEITLHSLPASTEFSAATGSGTDLGTYQSDSSGSATISVESSSNAEVYLFNNRAPEASNLSPANGSQLSDRNTEFSVDVSDPEFGTAQGDEVAAELFIDNESVGSKTISSNGTVTVTHQLSEGGKHSYYWKLTDSYGGSTTTDRNTIQTPTELRIYNESNPTELVDNVTVRVRFFFEDGDDLIVTRETNDGTVNFEGLPVNRQFVVVAQADGYRDRRIYVPSLFQTESVFLLPDNEEFVSPVFDIQDFTGSFPDSETVIRIQRPLNGSWRTVQADFFGASGEVPAQLEFNVRHRLILINTDTGETRRLGTYTPLEGGVQEIRVTPDSEIVVSPDGVTVQIDPSIGSLEATNETALNVSVQDPTGEVTSWDITISWQNETSSEVVYQETATGPIEPELDLSEYESGNITVLVEWDSPTDGTGFESKSYRLSIPMDNQYSLLNVLVTQLPGHLPASSWSAFSTMFAIAVSIFGATAVASKVPMSTEMIGLVAVGSLAGFSIIGFVGYEVVFVAGVGLVTMSMLRRGL